mmetsp:Transcript_40392/g.48982  ORF Transcript_40392/g.48982 Transcript_40392/m.48982 type:complete len:220 (+) Transcript_40392:589-1248(+)
MTASLCATPAARRTNTALRVYSEAHTFATEVPKLSGSVARTLHMLSYSPAPDMPSRSSTFALDRTINRPPPGIARSTAWMTPGGGLVDSTSAISSAHTLSRCPSSTPATSHSATKRSNSSSSPAASIASSIPPNGIHAPLGTLKPAAGVAFGSSAKTLSKAHDADLAPPLEAVTLSNGSNVPPGSITTSAAVTAPFAASSDTSTLSMTGSASPLSTDQS